MKVIVRICGAYTRTNFGYQYLTRPKFCTSVFKNLRRESQFGEMFKASG